jgi:hypothetical protein
VDAVRLSFPTEGDCLKNELKEKVRKWLMAADWKIQEGTSPDTPWIFRASTPEAPDLLIYPAKNERDALIVQCRFQQSAEQFSRWCGTSGKLREKVRMELQFLLAATDLNFEIDDNLEWFSVNDCIYPGALDQDSFWRRARKVRNITWSGAWIVLLAPEREPSLPVH